VKPPPRRGPPPRRRDDRRPHTDAPSREELTARLLEGVPPPFEVLYGVNPVREALRAGRRKARRLFVARREAGAETQEILKLANEKGADVREIDRDSLDAIVATAARTEAGGQGIAMAVTPYRYYSLEEIAGTKGETRRRLLALDEIEDPHNLGAMARTAEAAGLRGMLLQEHRAASVTPVAVKASAGAVEHLRVARETNLADALEKLKALGYWIVGLESAPEATDIYAADLDMDLVLVIGAEGKGLRTRVRSVCDLAVRLPMGGQVGSLNASAACAAAIYQALRPKR